MCNYSNLSSGLRAIPRSPDLRRLLASSIFSCTVKNGLWANCPNVRNNQYNNHNMVQIVDNSKYHSAWNSSENDFRPKTKKSTERKRWDLQRYASSCSFDIPVGIMVGRPGMKVLQVSSVQRDFLFFFLKQRLGLSLSLGSHFLLSSHLSSRDSFLSNLDSLSAGLFLSPSPWLRLEPRGTTEPWLR